LKTIALAASARSALSSIVVSSNPFLEETLDRYGENALVRLSLVSQGCHRHGRGAVGRRGHRCALPDAARQRRLWPRRGDSGSLAGNQRSPSGRGLGWRQTVHVRVRVIGLS
jgi:hypothetical protein